MSGTVVAVDAREGQTLNAQQQTPLILRIAKLSPMTVWAQVSEADIGKVKPGMTAYFNTLAGGKRRWTSTVRQILPVPPKPLDQSSQGGGSPASATAGTTGTKVVQYTVLLDVDNPDGALMAEMTTQVFFVAGQASQVLSAPLAALDDTPGDGVRMAQVLNNKGQIEARQVRTGLSDRLRVQILEGLNEGERLVIGLPAASGG
jgi:macrolide-specific efflux system membrane fusion protein